TFGSADVAFMKQYWVHLGVFNTLIDRTTPASTDPNVLYVKRIEIEILDRNGASIPIPGLPNPYSLLVSEYIDSRMGANPGAGTVSSPGIPPAYMPAICNLINCTDEENSEEDTIVLEISVIGETFGDVEVVSEPFIWPVRIRRGPSREYFPTGTVLVPPSCQPGQDNTPTQNCIKDGMVLGNGELVDACQPTDEELAEIEIQL
ncbi:MAG: hypothetical protein KC416_17655, partial [Myxococcales bacterium]|nr:hypothetical protein [Myxococcales bacterium]